MKKYISLVILISLLYLGFLIFDAVLITRNIPLTKWNKVPDQVYLRVDTKTIVLRDAKSIRRFHRIVSEKRASRVSRFRANQHIQKSVLSMEFGYKGSDFFIDKEGRILTSIYKSQIRNKSRIHWFWWKYDSFFGDRSTVLYYISDRDDEMAGEVGILQSIVKNSEQNGQ